ncbi:MAG: CHAT domain-containing protein, partial [Planctomycetes bacterium]|nr:CHAT domain-containing protein [Planctomycetota bacterium]
DRALHVATHLGRAEHATSGRLAPLGLELARGEQLLADAVAALKPRVPFAFLSACETGEGTFVDAQGLQGLARALLDAGTRDLLVTLWPVQDQAARDFALAFHRELAQGVPPSACAARARAELRDAGWPSSEWAAFRALGAD